MAEMSPALLTLPVGCSLPAEDLLPLPGVLHGAHAAEHHDQPGAAKRLRRGRLPGERHEFWARGLAPAISCLRGGTHEAVARRSLWQKGIKPWPPSTGGTGTPLPLVTAWRWGRGGFFWFFFSTLPRAPAPPAKQHRARLERLHNSRSSTRANMCSKGEQLIFRAFFNLFIFLTC